MERKTESNNQVRKKIYEKYIKRFIDIVCAILAIFLFWWLFIIIAILIRIKLGSPVIFKQKRPGLNEKIFSLYKFRTMTNEKDENGEFLPDDVRLTKFGKALRSTSLDELPEIWNILKGDMSIVGPRPQLVRDMVFMNEEQRKRHTVRQGLTGLAQINGRNNISWEAKLNYDLEYIKNITFLDDLKIVINTIIKVFRKEDVATNGMDTAEDYGDYLLKTNKVNYSEYQNKMSEAKKIIERVM